MHNSGEWTSLESVRKNWKYLFKTSSYSWTSYNTSQLKGIWAIKYNWMNQQSPIQYTTRNLIEDCTSEWLLFIYYTCKTRAVATAIIPSRSLYLYFLNFWSTIVFVTVSKWTLLHRPRPIKLNASTCIDYSGETKHLTFYMWYKKPLYNIYSIGQPNFNYLF